MLLVNIDCLVWSAEKQAAPWPCKQVLESVWFAAVVAENVKTGT